MTHPEKIMYAEHPPHPDGVMDLPDEARAVLEFWFGRADEAHHLRTRPEWFRKDDAFDRLIGARFGVLLEQAQAGGLNEWCSSTLGTLALIIVLDQFGRNVHRGSARAFAGDERALRLARGLVGSGADRTLAGVQRQFVYLPFEHAESLAAQQESLRLFAALGRDEPTLAGLLEWAERHQVIVARFGRFPHRNEALGRASTAEELVFLSQPGSSF